MLCTCELDGYDVTKVMRPTQICERDLGHAESIRPAGRMCFMRRPRLVNQRRCSAQGTTARATQLCQMGRLYLCASMLSTQKACFNGVHTRQIFMPLPAELGLLKHCAPTSSVRVWPRNAGMIWEQCYRHALETIGFTSGVPYPCVLPSGTRYTCRCTWRRLYSHGYRYGS